MSKWLPTFCYLTVIIFSLLLPGTLSTQPFSQYQLQPEQYFYNVHYYDINLDVNIASGFIQGYIGITGEIVQNNTQQIVLNLYSNMTVDSITSQGQNLTFNHANNLLEVNLASPLNVGENFALTVYYQGNPVTAGAYSSGLNFTTYNSQRLVYSLNWPYFACTYVPCKDHPSDKADSVRLAITVPNTHSVASTGILTAVNTLPGNKNQYIWESHYPLVPYNFCINIYPFDIVQSSYNSPVSGTISLEYYLFPVHSAAAQAILNTTVPKIQEAFESYFGAFPFAAEKYGICELSMPGFGMEHQTLLTMDYSFFFDIELPHESAHEYFGNMISIADWGHIWLSEGFATYLQAIYREYWEGPTGYQQEIAAHMAGSGNDAIYVTEPWDPQKLIPLAIVYRKASVVLHMLRYVMGDSLFFEMMYDYATNSPFRFKNIDTEQFCTFCEGYYGSDLNWFFDQWIYHDGKMAAEYYYYWNTSADSLIFMAHSIPSYASSTTYHAMPVPIEFTTSGDQFRDTLWIDSLNTFKKYYFNDTSNFSIQIDPEVKLLKEPFNFLDHPHFTAAYLDPQQNIIVAEWQTFFDYPDYRFFTWKKDSSGNYLLQDSTAVSGLTYSFTPAEAGTYRLAAKGVKDDRTTHLSNTMEVNYTQFALNPKILVIDETRNGNGTHMLLPTDQAVDAFYDSLLTGYTYQQLDIISEDRAPTVLDFAPYSLVLWHHDVTFQSRIGEAEDEIRTYLNAGGKIIISGMSFLNYLDLDFSEQYLGFPQLYLNTDADFTSALGLENYPDLTVDTAKITMPTYYKKLRNVAVFDTTDHSRAIYLYLSDSGNPQYQMRPCGLAANSVVTPVETAAITLGLPLYFTEETGAQLFLEKALEELDPRILPIEEKENAGIHSFTLYQNYPNPFNPSTTIEFFIPRASKVQLKIFNILGQEVATLVSGKLPAGSYKYEWQPKNLASGIYLYRLKARDYVETRKMVLMR